MGRLGPLLLLSVVAVSLFAFGGFIKPAQAEAGRHRVTLTYYQADVHDDHDWDIRENIDSNWKNPGDFRFGLERGGSWLWTEEIPVNEGETAHFNLTMGWFITSTHYQGFRIRAEEWDGIFRWKWVDYVSEFSTVLPYSWPTLNTWHLESYREGVYSPWSGEGDVTHYYKYYIENLAPTADSIDDQFVSVGVPVSFSGSGSDPEGDSISYEWNFDDGTTSVEQNPTHTFTDVGNYTVSFRVKDYFGRYSSYKNATVIVTKVIIDQTFVSKDRCDVGSTQTVGFHAKWSHDNTSIVGGSIYINETEYLTNGTGWISLNPAYNTVGKRIWNVTRVNCTNITVYEKAISDPHSTWDKVSITLSVVNDMVEVGSTASITRAAVYQCDGTDFDGTIALNDTLTKSTVGTFYYTTQSISGSIHGITAFDSNTVAITFVDTTAPVANAGLDQTVNEDTFATFDSSASTDIVGITNRTWTFTDLAPQTLTGIKPTYTFATPGNYTVTLKVVDKAGNQATDIVVIMVLDITKPVANAGSNQTLTAGNSVNFDAGNSTDNVGIVSYEWEFGDGTEGTGKTPFHTYTNVGTYTARLTVQDAAGNVASDTITITVQAQQSNQGSSGSSSSSSSSSSPPKTKPTPSPTPSPSPSPEPEPTPKPEPIQTKDPETASEQPLSLYLIVVVIMFAILGTSAFVIERRK